MKPIVTNPATSVPSSPALYTTLSDLYTTNYERGYTRHALHALIFPVPCTGIKKQPSPCEALLESASGPDDSNSYSTARSYRSTGTTCILPRGPADTCPSHSFDEQPSREYARITPCTHDAQRLTRVTGEGISGLPRSHKTRNASLTGQSRVLTSTITSMCSPNDSTVIKTFRSGD